MPSKKPTKKSSNKNVKITPTEKLKIQVNDLKSLVSENEEKYLRLKAEFDNFRKRKDKETMSLLKYEGETVIKHFLSALDDLNRLNEAISNEGSTTEKLSEGINLIINGIAKQLEKLDVKTFCNVGDVLDPDLHDALMIRHEKDKRENEIIEVFEKGYLYKDRVIRHAKVVVNQTPS